MKPFAPPLSQHIEWQILWMEKLPALVLIPTPFGECVQCGGPVDLSANKGRWPKVYCGGACKAKAYRERLRSGRIKAVAT
jgi:hypothetical protein